MSWKDKAYEIRLREIGLAKEVEQRALAGEKISYSDYLRLYGWLDRQLCITWFEGCGLFWRLMRLKPAILRELTGGHAKGFTTMTGAR